MNAQQVVIEPLFVTLKIHRHAMADKLIADVDIRRLCCAKHRAL